MSHADDLEARALQAVVEQLWEQPDEVRPGTSDSARKAIEAAIAGLDSGRLRIAEPDGERWIVHDWLKKAVLLWLRLSDSRLISGAADGGPWWDKVPSKFAGWGEAQFRSAGFRAVPGSVVRRGAYVGRDVVLMPSFVNIGAYVGDRTMVDTWASVGSCAHVGANVHLSGGVGIGGVLEPVQAAPVIIEDDCFIGARSEVVEGVIVGRGSVLSMGVYVTASTKIVDRATGEITTGRIPPYSVVVPGTLPGAPTPDGTPAPSLYCVVIVKRVDAQTRSKTSINDMLRDG